MAFSYRADSFFQLAVKGAFGQAVHTKPQLSEASMPVVELTKDNFEQVITSNATVIVDYWAPWCGPCRGFAPVFERVAEQNPGAVFAKVNTDEEQEIASHFQIRSIPTLMVFRDQIIVFSQPGALPQSALEQVVEKAQALDMNAVRAQIGKQESAPPPAA
ncbi:MAG TPA: thioredoxin [Usitatibacter sp.]